RGSSSGLRTGTRVFQRIDSRCRAAEKQKARAFPSGPPTITLENGALHRPDVLRLQALRALGHVDADLLTLGQRAEPFRRDGGVMAEDILAAAVLRDEAEPLRIIEPLHSTSRHLLFRCC